MKVEKYVYKRMADIYFHRIDCTETNILTVLNLFSWDKVVSIIGDVQKDDPLFEEIKRLSLKYTTSPEGKTPYFDVVVATDIEQFKGLVKFIFESDSEGFAITNIKGENQIELKQFLYNKIPIRKMIKQGEYDLSISVAIQESTIAITLSKETYDTSMLSRKAKEIKKIF